MKIFKQRYYFILLSVIFSAMLLQGCSYLAADKNHALFEPVESTIAQLQQALTDKTTSCVAITQAFLQRIKTYDKSTKLNAIILLNPKALNKARLLDEEFSATHKLRPLHCVPVILKDNYDTADMVTEAGAIALKGSIPPDDAFMVKKLRDAGAIILAKSNMGEWAFSPYNTISSTHGETRNAYDLQRVPAGSSGGTASAIAASFGIIGMGTDTGNSIRGPASHLALVGIRSTMGLTSRDGVVPLLSNRDIAGPLTRTVEDAAKTFSVIAGYDAADPVTHNAMSHTQTDYTQYLNSAGLNGVRLGVLRELFDTDTADPEVMRLMNQAIDELKLAGAIIVDPFVINDFDGLSKATGFCSRFRYDLDNYLSTLNSPSTNSSSMLNDNDNDNQPPLKSFQQMVDHKWYAEQSEEAIQWATAVNVTPQEQQPPCVDVKGDSRRKDFLAAVLGAMNTHRVDAIIYPSWSNPARNLADLTSPHGNNSPVISPHTGQPSITVPMGFTHDGLPTGLQFLARPFDDASLFQYAYAYEHGTHHRQPPDLFPAIRK